MSKSPEIVDDSKHKLDTAIPRRHSSTFRPSFDQNYNIKTGAGNNVDLAVRQNLLGNVSFRAVSASHS